MRQPTIQWSRWAMLISILGHIGDTDEARRSIESLRPDIGLEFVRGYWPIRNAASLDYLLEGLAKAGLRE